MGVLLQIVHQQAASAMQLERHIQAVKMQAHAPQAAAAAPIPAWLHGKHCSMKA
jgi:hypothetical protein